MSFNNFFYNFFLSVFLLLVCSSIVLPVGMQSERGVVITYEPNLEYTYSYGLVNAEFIESYVSGDIAQYVTLNDPEPFGGPRTIQGVIKLPENLEPGEYALFFGGKEYAGTTGTVGAVGAIQTRVTVRALYPGIYPKFLGISTPDLPVNDSVNFSLSLHNYGKETILLARGEIEIFDSNNNSITILTTGSSSIESNTPLTLYTRKFIPKDFNLGPGVYTAIGRLYINGELFNETRTSTFRIGTLNMEIVDWSKELIVNATNRFEIRIRSDWSGPIEDVHARIQTRNNKNLKTPNLDINKFEEATLEAYWDTKGLPLGQTSADIELFFAGKSIKKTVELNIIDGEPPKIEKPESKFDLTMTVIIAGIVLIILTIINLIIFSRRKNNNSPPRL